MDKHISYSFFAELQGQIAKEFSFLSKAVSDDVTRYFMNFILVEQMFPDDPLRLRAVSTDGRRLHIVEPLSQSIESLLPGRYRVIKSTSKSVQIIRVSDETVSACGDFPNWQRVMPQGDVEATVKFEGLYLSGPNLTSSSAKLFDFIRDFPDTTRINFKYLADLPADVAWEAKYRGQGVAVEFVSTNMRAVIMPMMA